MLDEKFQLNASKFATLYIYENPKLLFPFCATLVFSLMNALVYVTRAMIRGKKFAQNEKQKKATLGFRMYKI